MNSSVAIGRLIELLQYDPLTGVLTWRKTRGGILAGTAAGRVNYYGYVIVTIDGHKLFGHRIAWAMVHGGWPDHELDHKDNCRTNNRLENLRPATRAQQTANSRKHRDNVSGFKGATFHPSGKWQARIVKDGKIRSLGYFDSPEQAHAAYVTAAENLFGPFAKGV